MIIAFYIGKFFASSIKKAKTFVFELGLQNGSVAIFVADSIFGGGPFIIPAATNISGIASLSSTEYASSIVASAKFAVTLEEPIPSVIEFPSLFNSPFFI